MKMSAFDLTDHRSGAAQAAVMPNLVPFQSVNNDSHAIGEVISHPEDFPIEVRRTVPWKSWFAALRGAVGHDVVLRFFSGDSFHVGNHVRITIPLRHKNNHFEAKVAGVKRLRIGYETTVAISLRSDAERLRVVERICALECELQRSIKVKVH